jgi:hypothetical protein
MHEAYEILASIEPLPPNASPRSVQCYRKLMKNINAYIGRMTEYVEGVSTASHIDAGLEGLISFLCSRIYT